MKVIPPRELSQSRLKMAIRLTGQYEKLAKQFPDDKEYWTCEVLRWHTKRDDALADIKAWEEENEHISTD